MIYICPDCGAIVHLPKNCHFKPICPMAIHKCTGQHNMVKSLLRELLLSNPDASIQDLRILNKELNR